MYRVAEIQKNTYNIKARIKDQKTGKRNNYRVAAKIHLHLKRETNRVTQRIATPKVLDFNRNTRLT